MTKRKWDFVDVVFVSLLIIAIMQCIAYRRELETERKTQSLNIIWEVENEKK